MAVFAIIQINTDHLDEVMDAAALIKFAIRGDSNHELERHGLGGKVQLLTIAHERAPTNDVGKIKRCPHGHVWACDECEPIRKNDAYPGQPGYLG